MLERGAPGYITCSATVCMCECAHACVCTYECICMHMYLPLALCPCEHLCLYLCSDKGEGLCSYVCEMTVFHWSHLLVKLQGLTEQQCQSSSVPRTKMHTHKRPSLNLMETQAGLEGVDVLNLGSRGWLWGRRTSPRGGRSQSLCGRWSATSWIWWGPPPRTALALESNSWIRVVLCSSPELPKV